MGLRVEERIVAGGEEDDLVVHHLVLRGSAGAIGRHLGELVRARYGPARGDLHRERLRCSAAFTPARRLGSGHPLVARTFEAAGPLGRSRPGEPPTAGRPYVMELHPDDGHPSLAVCAFELEGAALDGVNAEGLVAVAAPDLAAEPPCDLAALEIVRTVLDRCATAAAARALILAAARPGRWLVADQGGDAFVVEIPSARSPARCLDAAGAPLELTTRLDDAPLRTLWHGEYDPVERRLTARFFVGAGEWRRGLSPDLLGPAARGWVGGEAPELRFQLG
jgi:hypothetical protein